MTLCWCVTTYIGSKSVASSDSDRSVGSLAELGDCSAGTIRVADLPDECKKIAASLKDSLHGVGHLVRSGNGAWGEDGQHENLTKLQRFLVGRLGCVLGKHMSENAQMNRVSGPTFAVGWLI